MAIDPEQIPEKLPDPATCKDDTITYYQYEDVCLKHAAEVTEADRPSPVGPRFEPVLLKKTHRHYAGLVWRFEYLRWKSGNGTKRRLHAGMIQDAVLLAVIEDMRRDLRPPTELGQRCMETKPGWLPMIEVHFAAVRCVHTIVGWAALHPNEGAR